MVQAPDHGRSLFLTTSLRRSTLMKSFCDNPRYPQVLALIRQMELLLKIAVRMQLLSGGLPRQKCSYIQLDITPRYRSRSFDADLSPDCPAFSIEMYSMIVNAVWQSVLSRRNLPPIASLED